MSELPATLQSAIPAELLSDADHWWDGLSDADQAELQQLCDARKEIFLFETVDAAGTNPRITGGKFLPHDDALGLQEWGEDYFDYLLGHPELMIVFDPTRRTFHIGCSRHADAQACFQTGIIRQDFLCPFARGNCLMEEIRGQRRVVGLRRMRVD